jgi:D-alanyl-lipoteichoic acid acyltransferase DltB (MBOAT superfamily)
MIFNSVSYLLFLILVVCLFWLLPQRQRLWMIFVSSLVFYGLWRPEFVILMICSAGTDFIAARYMGRDVPEFVRRRWLAFSLTVNLGLLFYFKYLFFFASNAVALFHLFGVSMHTPVLDIVLPLGISFYTFQTISYVLDVYRRDIVPEKDFLLYGCFVTFFPQLVAGPILRGNQLINQLSQKPSFHLSNCIIGLRRILIGLFLKVVIADNIAPLVDEGFSASVSHLSAIDVLTLAFLFGFQIYFDFSAYSHIALGSASLMGIHFPENFNFPYIARSPKEFWQRWHISLSTWVRDYLYLPLLGSVVRDYSASGRATAGEKRFEGRWYPILVLYISWAVMGFWHGANWTFLFWGLYHATLIVAYRASESVRMGLPLIVRNIGGWGISVVLIMLGWVPFRSNSLENTLDMFGLFFIPHNYTWLGMRENNYLVATFLMLSFLLSWFLHQKRKQIEALPVLLLLAVEIIITSFVIGLVFVFLRPTTQFIYFQF